MINLKRDKIKEKSEIKEEKYGRFLEKKCEECDKSITAPNTGALKLMFNNHMRAKHPV